jgi:hypothetical protein
MRHLHEYLYHGSSLISTFLVPLQDQEHGQVFLLATLIAIQALYI